MPEFAQNLLSLVAGGGRGQIARQQADAAAQQQAFQNQLATRRVDLQEQRWMKELAQLPDTSKDEIRKAIADLQAGDIDEVTFGQRMLPHISPGARGEFIQSMQPEQFQTESFTLGQGQKRFQTTPEGEVKQIATGGAKTFASGRAAWVSTPHGIFDKSAGPESLRTWAQLGINPKDRDREKLIAQLFRDPLIQESAEYETDAALTEAKRIADEILGQKAEKPAPVVPRLTRPEAPKAAAPSGDSQSVWIPEIGDNVNFPSGWSLDEINAHLVEKGYKPLVSKYRTGALPLGISTPRLEREGYSGPPFGGRKIPSVTR